MQIKRYRGSDMQDALHKVKQDLGADAIILSTRQVRGGKGTFGLFGKPMLEVTAARDGELEPELDLGASLGASAAPAGSVAAALARSLAAKSGTAAGNSGLASLGLGNLASGKFAESAAAKVPAAREEHSLRQLIARQRVETQSLLAPLQDDIHELKEILRAVGDSQRGAARDDGALTSMRAEIADMRQMLHVLASQASGLKDTNFAENLVVLYQQLLFNGMEEKFARRLIEECAKTIPPKDLEDFSYVKIFLARMLMKIVKVTGPIQADPGRQRIVALIGPTGVGKTTTVAKLASEQLLRHHRQVALITVDTFRIAAVEQLKIYAKIMSVPITVVNSRGELHQAIRAYRQKDVVFIDTGGRSQRDNLQMSELVALFGGDPEQERGGIETYLALSATTKDADLTEITRKFAEVPLSGMIFTKLDESSHYGAIFNHCIRFKTPVAYLTTGQKVPEDLEVATKERLVDLLLNISAG